MNDKNETKISHISAVDQVSERIKQAITSGQWKVGTRLPSEGELAEIYGVNRLTVRMALQKLNVLGIIETKVGAGSYVRDFSLARVFDGVSEFFAESKPHDEIYALRMLIEVECCRLAIDNATGEEMEDLNRQLGRYLEAKEICQNSADPADLEKLVDEDLLFHYQICRISRNSIYEDIFLLTRNYIRQYLTTIISIRKQKGSVGGYTSEEDTHVKIYEALKAKDFKSCKKAYHKTVYLDPDE
ncbi:FadR/GntR family transcriptional regulator [Breznakiella homolactica]|uniref:FadR family transcriptional regulator n=1 Tax=Breznakiella homolactica TaxID=2798577 RepID=A0A7T7XL71_9SPIR|nr:GntR family transcriptional regulator [Breznakiella homolactica]QQO08401.1 GntR family transcriptional regulator [Breznakiella homolactica]